MFDNYQFVNFHKAYDSKTSGNPDANFAMNTLMEIPEQYAEIQRLGLMTPEHRTRPIERERSPVG